MARRKLEELNLLDDFLFGTMVTYPEIGEKFIRELLKVIFQKDFGNLTVVSQKTYLGSDTDKHGARLDVYVEEDAPETATICDVEPDKNNRDEDVRALPKRTRFYHAVIDSKSLKAGEDYQCLKKVVVLMITDYDPFGWNRMFYTVRSMCEEEPEMPYDDGAKTIYLYTKGKKGNPPEELKAMLHYLEDTKAENAVNDTLKDFQQMVDTVKQDREVSLEYMIIFRSEEMFREQGRKEERENTERERKRAEAAEAAAEQDLQLAMKVLGMKNLHPEWDEEQLAKNCGCAGEKVREILEAYRKEIQAIEKTE